MAEVTKITTPSLSSPVPPPNEQITGLVAGEALGIFDACYIKGSDGKVYKATGAANTAPARVRGWTPKACAINEKGVTLYFGNVNVNYGAGLAPGTDLFLSGTVAGGLADAASTGGLRVIAFVLDATRIRLLSPQST